MIFRRKVSRSAILREAVEQYLERQQFPVRKAKGGRQKGEVVGVDDQCKEHKEWQKFFILEYKKTDALILVLIQGCFTWTYNNCNCYIISGKRLAKIKNDA